MMVWTRARGVALAIGIAAMAPCCAPDETPMPLLGTWYSDDARFEGRRLEIRQHSIRFMQGRDELSAIRVREVTQEGDGAGPIRIEIAGIDRDGQDATLVFELQQHPKELLRLETQREAWRRGGRPVEFEGVQ